PSRPPLFPYTTLFRSESREVDARATFAPADVPAVVDARGDCVAAAAGDERPARLRLVAVRGDDVQRGRAQRGGTGHASAVVDGRSEEHTSELQSRENL